VDNRRVLIAVLLSLAVLIAWQFLFPPAERSAVPPAAPAVEQPSTGGAEPAAGTASPGAAAADSAAGSGAADDAAAATAPAAEPAVAEAPEEPFEPVAAERQQEVVVDTDLYRAVLDNRGGQLVSFVLKEHQSLDGGAVDLVRHRREGAYPFGFVDGAGNPLPLNDRLFSVERSTVDGDVRIVLRYADDGVRAEKRFLFHDNGVFDASVEVERLRDWSLLVGPGIRNPSEAELKNRFERRSAVYETGDDLKRLQPNGTAEREELPAGALRWVGLEDTYFLTALIPQQPLRAVTVIPYLAVPSNGDGWIFRPLPPKDELSDEEEDLPRDLAVVITPVDGSIDLRAYWGAKKYQRLADLPYDLERTVTIWSWLRPIAVPILWALLWIHDNLVHNYGWAIVLVTILIKLLLSPLTHKSFVSMRKMQKLNPQMQAIRAKWRGKLRDKQGKMNLDAQRQMNEEMQNLYKTAGVNPAGGCLPMILQMPVLFAFYQLLTASVELRGQPWILWITDLTQPFWPLAVVMGATQFIQQRMTPMAGDPMQRRLMQAMPLVWTLFFLKFPSGLVLYWLTNNVLTILQQGILNRFLSKQDDESAPDAQGGKAHKGSKGSRRVASK